MTNDERTQGQILAQLQHLTEAIKASESERQRHQGNFAIHEKAVIERLAKIEAQIEFLSKVPAVVHANEIEAARRRGIDAEADELRHDSSVKRSLTISSWAIWIAAGGHVLQIVFQLLNGMRGP